MRRTLHKKAQITLLYGIAFLCCMLLAPMAHASEFVALQGLPGVNVTPANLAEYLNGIYYLLIGVGTLMAVIKIALAGVQYAMSDVITDKSGAKKDIEGALLGLAILLLPFVILNTIYPQLTSLDILKNLTPINVAPMPANNAPSNQAAQCPSAPTQPCVSNVTSSVGGGEMPIGTSQTGLWESQINQSSNSITWTCRVVGGPAPVTLSCAAVSFP